MDIELFKLYFVDDTKSIDENINNILKFRGITSNIDAITNYSELLKLFKKDSINNYEVVCYTRDHHIHKWTKSFASSRLKGKTVSPLNLEPFVARYIIAINDIGIKTYFSCDGWHKEEKNSLTIGFEERNSMVWHKIITSIVSDNLNLQWSYEGTMAKISLPQNDNKKIELYKVLNNRAEYFEVNQEKLFQVKKDIIDAVKNKPKNMLSDDELEKFLRKNMK